MKYFSRDWKKIKDKVIEKDLVLFLDFDGTLTPLRKRPKDVTLNEKVRNVLKELSKLDGITICIVSGRELSDVKKRVGLNQLIYAGNHGFEIKGPKINFIKPEAKKLKPLFQEITKQLRKTFKTYSGILVENKTYSLSIHYRLLPFFKVDACREALLKVLTPYLEKEKIIVTEGKKVWEVRPPVEWNKGKAVLWLLEKLGGKGKTKVVPFYFGDDVTDEDAFEALKKQGITVRVGHPKGGKSKAQYYVRNVEVVHLFLNEFYQSLIEEGEED